MLRSEGFTNLTGIDPYIRKDICYANGINIWKKTIAEVDQEYDFVIINHAFEHMSEPRVVLRELRRILKPNCCTLIRIPIAGSYAWNKYGVNWVQLDAPRHLFLHTSKSMEILTAQTGFTIRKIFQDSNEFQFVGSEMYLKGLHLLDETKAGLFPPEVIVSFRKKAELLNKEGKGDQAGFFLWKS
ncbi:MAG: class I SAM-dependent methyltransferase [Pyrinomonadaceae bacterium MAG19_C2-C3]|nr:class I SAM-dependent methyltransferase [Pyrinomonadaceae bacterium MAG19_C2-C3]